LSNKNLLYYGTVAIILILLVMEGSSRKTVVWTKTFSRFDKNPYGSYALGKLVDELFPNKKISKSNLTFYEIFDVDEDSKNFLSISENFSPDQTSWDSLAAKVSMGSTAFISATSIPDHISEELDIKVDKVIFYDPTESVIDQEDSASFEVNDKVYSYNEKELSYYLSEYPTDSKVISRNKNKAITIKLKYGDGQFIINTTPIIFSNHFLLFENNHKAVSSTLSMLPNVDTHWTEYYQVGKLNSSSPLRVILEHVELRTALYILLLLIVVYIFFDAKRKQRIIPIIQSPANHTIQFIKTVGNLYFNTGNHKAAAVNQVYYFKEYLSMKLNIHLSQDVDSSKVIAAKSAKDLPFIEGLLKKINAVEQTDNITDRILIELNQDLHKFYS